MSNTPKYESGPGWVKILLREIDTIVSKWLATTEATLISSDAMVIAGTVLVRVTYRGNALGQVIVKYPPSGGMELFIEEV